MKRLRTRGWTLREIARKLGRSIETVQRRLSGVVAPVKLKPPVETPAERQAAARAVPERRARARATPEHTCGPDPEEDLDINLSGEGDPLDGLIPEGAAERLAEVWAAREKKPKR
jgi:transcriptional regulator with XRE-family HTH domain